MKRIVNIAGYKFVALSELRSLRALAETTALINSAQKADDVLNQVMDTVIALTGAERADLGDDA